MKQQRGFTLVELAVVMVLIAVLIGGALKGQEMLTNARIIETIADIRHYDTAMRQFRTIYNAIPGDMRGASHRLQGCNENCEPWFNPSVVSGGRAGDGLIGDTALGYFKTAQSTISHPPDNENEEPTLFWLHLLKANLIGGVTDRGMLEEDVTTEWNVTHPKTKIGGGFIVSSGERSSDGMVRGSPTMFPYELIIVEQPNKNIEGSATPTKNMQPMTSLRAWDIDKKMDDGNPSTGIVRGIGHIPTCFANAGTNLYRYDTTVTTNDCSVVVEIQH